MLEAETWMMRYHGRTGFLGPVSSLQLQAHYVKPSIYQPITGQQSLMHTRVEAILFDFDYTLADSSAGVIACFNFALSILGFESVVPEMIQATIGLNLKDAFQRLVGSGECGRFREFFRLYNQKADRVMTNSTVLLDSVPETVQTLLGMDLTLGIVSTKEHYRITDVLERELLLGSFDVIVGGDEVSFPKPDPEGLLNAIESLNVLKANCLYVGDSLIDAQTARRAQVPFVAILTGMTLADEFDGYDVYVKISDLAELPDLLN